MARTARDLGVRYVYFAPLTLPGGGVLLRVLETRYPGLAERYREIYRDGYRPSEGYAAWFYRRAFELSRRYGLKWGGYALRSIGRYLES